MTSDDATEAVAVAKRQRPAKASALGVMILSLLREKPMHPYEMQRVMIERAKDAVVKVQRGSLYPAVERLAKAGLLQPVEVSRDGKRPERTVYELTEEGRETAQDWLLEMLRTPSVEYPDFAAALAFTPILTPAEFGGALERRALRLAGDLASMESTLQEVGTFLPRLFVIETEFQSAMLSAELRWVRALLEDIKSGNLDWDEERIRAWGAEAEAALMTKP